jgi:hypothetical protein
MAWPDKIKRLYLDGTYINEILRMSDLYRSAIRYAFKKHLMAR